MSLQGTQLNLVTSTDEAAEFKRWLGERHENDAVAVDTETTGLNPRAPKAGVRLIQFGDTKTGWAIPWLDWRGLALEALNQYEGTWIYHNCFSGDTEYLTREGVRTLAGSVGESVEVWDGDEWRKADIRAFGEQSLQKITLAPRGRRTNYREVIYATPRHRWELINGLLTVDIRVGDIIPMAAPVDDVVVDEDNIGFIHGLIYADGTLQQKGSLSADGEFRHQMRLCGPKARHASLFTNVTYPDTYGGDPQVYFKHRTNFKSLPDTSDPGYLRAFIGAWAELDGTRNSTDRARQLCTTRHQDVAWLVTNAALGGFVVTGITEGVSTSGFAAEGHERYWNVTLWSMEKNDDDKTRKRFNSWRVESIEPVPGLHPVYCAVVPETERFTLANGVYTSNCAFEMKWIHEHSDYRLPRSRSVDTMIGAHIINPLGSGALKGLSVKYVDPKASAGQNLLQEGFAKHGWDWATVPVDYEPYWSYSALDTVLTAQLWDKFKGQLTGAGAYRDVFDLEMAVRFIVSGMEERGARVDLDYSQEWFTKLNDDANAVSDWAEGAFGINIASNKQLGETLVRYGGELFEFTATGQPKVDKYTLDILSDPDNAYPAAVQTLATQALRLRGNRKFASTYFANFLSQNVDGYIHADIRTLGARTGRMSVGQPALQQLPKNSSLVRNAFIPRDGNVLVTCDFSQIEGRLLAEASADDKLQSAFLRADATGGDFFAEIGKQAYSEPGFQKSDKRRGLLKSMIYGRMYGAGVPKMAETAGIPVARMEEVVRAVDEQFPGMQDFMTKIESKGVEREYKEGEGYVVTPVGRRLPCDKGKAYTLTNYYLQSYAADVLKKALIRLDAAGYDDYLILPVHDEVVIDIPKEYAEQALRDVPLIMQELDHPVPLTAESDGPLERWGDRYK